MGVRSTLTRTRTLTLTRTRTRTLTRTRTRTLTPSPSPTLTLTRCAPLGMYAALLTNANAALNIYILLCHPDYTSGRVSRLAIDGQRHQAVATEEGGVITA